MLLHTHSAGTLTHDGDGAGVTAESGNVIPHLLQGGQLIVEAVVAGEAGFFFQLWQADETHRTQAIVQCDADDALGGPDRTVEVLFGAAAAGEAAAMDIEDGGAGIWSCYFVRLHWIAAMRASLTLWLFDNPWKIQRPIGSICRALLIVLDCCAFFDIRGVKHKKVVCNHV